MIVALIDNGSLEPSAHRNLRALAATISARSGVEVHAVSWKHSDALRADQLDGAPGVTLETWVRARHAAGEREFVFIPFFISAQGAIGSALRRDLEQLQRTLGPFRFAFTEGLAARDALVPIVTDRIRRSITSLGLTRPAVVVVDHGGPSAASAILRNQIAAEAGHRLGDAISALSPASLEGGEYAHARPLFGDVLATTGFDREDVVVAPLFLAPGRHAGPNGDLAQIAREAEDRLTPTPLRCHFTELVGTHPLVAEVLSDALTRTLTTFHVAA